jgi:predicted PurR-regulated permease PerM
MASKTAFFCPKGKAWLYKDCVKSINVDAMSPLRAIAVIMIAGPYGRIKIMVDDKSKSMAINVKPGQSLRVDIAPKTMILTMVVAAGTWLVVQLIPVLVVLVIALMIVGTLSPAVYWLEARDVRRSFGIAIVFGILMLLLLLLGMFTVPALFAQIADLIHQEPAIRAQVIQFLSAYPMTEFLAEALRDIRYDLLIKSSTVQVLAFSTRLLQIFAYGAGAFFLALYMMIDRDRLRGALFAVTPRPHHIRLSRILINMETIVGGYIRGQLITCLLMGMFMFALLTACGIPNALALATFGGLVDLLPFIGIFLTMGPAVLAALARGTEIALIVFVLLLCYEEFESRVLIPLVYGRALRLPSSVVLFALIAGGTLSGVLGALLALPVAATILMLIDELEMEMPGEDEQAQAVEEKIQDEISNAEYQRRTEGMPAGEAAAVAVEISLARKKEEGELPLDESADKKDEPQK